MAKNTLTPEHEAVIRTRLYGGRDATDSMGAMGLVRFLGTTSDNDPMRAELEAEQAELEDLMRQRRGGEQVTLSAGQAKRLDALVDASQKRQRRIAKLNS